ncbi:MAG: cob(I)yrinic acid a,c-diamide adenosyltransferase [Hominilimicola sp.]
MIHVYCGDGKGKTTASIGLAVRMAGYKKKVLFMQFLKGSYTGELEILQNCKNIIVMRCDKNYGFYRSMTDADKENIVRYHNENLEYVLKNMTDFDMIVFDEIFAAYNYDLADKERVKEIVEKYSGELVMTGRDPQEWFVEKADYVSEIKKIKHPYDKGITAREGIEF